MSVLTGDRVRDLHRHDPDRLGDYRLVGRLGSGGMGVVYLARDSSGGHVAIKLVHADLAGDEDFLARFRSEVERAREVPSYCTAEVIDADLDHDPPYLVVEYVDGPSLAEVVEEHGPLSPSHLHSVAAGVATALAGIHGAGVMHRDLKPDNVLLAPGSPKVIDFGIARAFEATSGHTKTNHMVGTVAYMAPERFSSAPGTAPGPAADVFAWGCVVGYAATGRTPFHGDSPQATAGRILTQRPHLGGLAEPLRSMVELSLAKDPRHRPTARELLDMLVGGRPVPPPAGYTPAAFSPASPAASSPAPPAALSPAPPAAFPPAPAAVPVRADPARPAHQRAHSRSKVAALVAVLLVLTGLTTIAAVMRADGPDGEAVAAPRGAVTTAPSAGLGGPPAAPPASAAAPPARASASVPASARASASASAPPRRRAPAEPRGGDPIIQASLRIPGPYLDALCPTIGIMTVTRFERGTYRCGGPQTSIGGDFGVSVSTGVQSSGACAGVWFHFSGDGGHLVRVCRDAVRIGTDSPGGRRTLATLRLDDTLPLGQEVRLHLAVRDGLVDVWLDGDHLGSARLPAGGPDEGRVLVGISSDAAVAGPPYTVTFADIDIRDLG